MALNDYVTLGRSGLRVSPFCLGAMTFGEEWGLGSTPEGSFAVLDAYIAHGGNFIDSANNGIPSGAWPLGPKSDDERW